MRADKKDYVKSISLFAHMTPEAFETLLSGAYLQRFPERVELIHEGEAADFLHVVLSGSVELYSAWNDHECSMAIIRPISTFILAAVIKEAPYLMSARTIEASEVLMIPSENLRRAMETNGDFALAMVRELAASYRAVVKSAKDMKLRSGVERLANYLLRLNSEQNGRGEVKLPIGKAVLASLLGMTPENLSRAFATLRPYGVVVDGATIILSNMRDLKTLAKPTPLIDDSLS